MLLYPTCLKSITSGPGVAPTFDRYLPQQRIRGAASFLFPTINQSAFKAAHGWSIQRVFMLSTTAFQLRGKVKYVLLAEAVFLRC
jgi:hypothetical protein